VVWLRVLVVDDDAETRHLLVRSLASAGHAARAVASGAEARSALEDQQFEVIVLDVMLPDVSGVELCRSLRRNELTTPIVLLTARGDVRDRVAGLDAGADDYLGKPFAIAELVARVRALGRRGSVRRVAPVRAGDVTVDLEGRRVLLAGRTVALTARELAIVEVLALRRGGVVAREELLEAVWGEVDPAAEASLEVLVGRIRRKLGGPRAPIRTVRGLGYAFESDR
jgi:two-component system OmpR family response regulator